MKLFLKIIGVLAILFILAVGGVVWYVHRVIYTPQGSGAHQVVTISNGEGSAEIASRLAAAGVVKSAPIFRLYLYQKGAITKLQAGSYDLDPTLTMPEIASVLTQGAIISNEKTVTIREGLRRDEVATVFEEAGLVKASDFMKATEDASKWNYPFLKDVPEGQGLEGFLYPDTYRFFEDATVENIVNTLLINFAERNAAVILDATTQNKNLYEVVTLASIVDAEVPTLEDRKLVAGVFANRLAVGMPLQSDVTLNYVFKETKTNHTIAETKVSDPYNTYLNKGLPPGPINSPTVTATEAALNPGETDALYFISTPEGEVIYSKTLEQHNAAVKKYLRN